MEEEVSYLEELLETLRTDLTADVMPRAARLTGTLSRLVMVAIAVTNELAKNLQARSCIAGVADARDIEAGMRL